MKKLFMLALLLNSVVLFGQAQPISPGNPPTPTYTYYYTLFSDGWLGNKNFALATEYPSIEVYGSQLQGLGEYTHDFDAYQNTTTSDSQQQTTLTQNENAEWALRAEFFGFLVEAERVAINISGGYSNPAAARPLIAQLHTLASYKELKKQLNQNWNATTSSYSADPSRDQLTSIYNLLVQCKADELATLVTAAQLAPDELANYNAFRALQSTINPNNSVTLDYFQFSSLEYLNVLLARRVSIANGNGKTDGFADLNNTLLNLNLNAPGVDPDRNNYSDAATVDIETLGFTALDAMSTYEHSVAPLIAW